MQNRTSSGAWFAIPIGNTEIPPMPESVTVERVQTRETTIKVDAPTPQEAFDKVRAGEGEEIGTVETSVLVIRDYGEEGLTKTELEEKAPSSG
jgi:hypothetical protein